jgi:hypothetical protein
MNITPTRIAKELSRVRVSLRTLDKALRGLTPVLTADTRLRLNGAAKATVRVSAKTRTARVLQGRYMGYMRQLKPRQKMHVRRIREVQGVRAAIMKAKNLANG